MNRFSLRLKISLDGRRAYLLNGAVREVSITWSDKDQQFHLYFKSKAQLSFSDYHDFISEVVKYVVAYKKEADKLERQRQALELIVNQ